jgi:hypothetical protein
MTRAVALPGWMDRLRGHRLETAALVATLALAAALRFVNLPYRGGWDSDQAVEMLALREALRTGTLPTFGPVSSLGNFHHGALSRDIELPAAWIGNGDPVWVVVEVALLSLLVVVAAWWIARSISGTAAGLCAALLAAVSASQVTFATFIWNPTPVEPGAALAFLGAWAAIRRRSGRWWLVAAAGTALAAQSHIAAAVIVIPIAGAFIVDLYRGPSGRRGRIAGWGVAGVALFVATYLPQIAWELGHGFADTRGALEYFTAPAAGPNYDPLTRLVFSAVRILAWPLTRWPLIELKAAAPVAFVAALGLAGGLVARLWATRRAARVGAGAPAAEHVNEAALVDAAPLPGAAPTAPEAALPGVRQGAAPLPDGLRPGAAPLPDERLGTWLVAGGLASLVLALGLGVHSVSEVQALPTEQYHVVADPLVFVAAGIALGGPWRAVGSRSASVAVRGIVVVLLAAVVAWNVAHQPPLESPSGSWPAAQAAAQRVEKAADGSAVALVALFEPKGTTAYGYPLTLDGVTLSNPETAPVVVLLCDTYWLDGCGGEAEAAWIAKNAAGSGLVLVDRFAAAPDRLLSVYRRAP